jgi:hypothetical protein
MAPGVLRAACAAGRRDALAHVQPGFQFPQQLIDATRQRNQLLVLGGLVVRHHSRVNTRGAFLQMYVRDAATPRSAAPKRRQASVDPAAGQA